ncbi:hypothetical protein MMC17_005102 [Xylographa soralifera]|nr:hypothetical protein [Xylographa soralifera]
MLVLLLLLTITTASPTVSSATISYNTATAAVVIYDGPSAWSINMNGKATETIIPLYNLTPTPSTSLTSSIGGPPSTATSTASIAPTRIASTSVSSLKSQPTLTFPQPSSTSTASPVNTSNGSLSAPDSNTFADPTTSAVMAGAVTGGCLLGGLAIAFFWLLWKRMLHKRQKNQPTIRNKLIDARRLKAVWSSASIQTQSRSTQTTLWDEVRDGFSDPENPFRDSLASSTVSDSRIGNDTASEGGYQETTEAQSERLDRLFRRNHSPVPLERHGFNNHSFGAVRNSYPMDWLSGPRSATMMPLPPILKRASVPAPLFTGRDFPGSPPSAQIKPTQQDSSSSKPLKSPLRSLLKSPQKSPLKQSGTMSSTEAREDFSSTMASGTKKEVRFGGEQIKEFGRTPYASTVNSVMEELDDQILTV